MSDFYAKTIREIAVEFPQTVGVFESFKIDFCCGGERNFSEACKTAGVKPEIVSNQLDSVLRNQTHETDIPEKKKVTNLIDYIIEKHHVFTRDEITRITPLLEKVCGRHGNSHPELYSIQKTFQLLADELLTHLQKEEKVLFPYIKVLDAVVSTNIPIAEPHFKTVKNPVRMMMTEHDAAGDLLKQIRQSSNGFALPKGVCTSYQLLYLSLEALEKDLHRHIHLENNVLFPQSIELENKVFDETKTDENYECHSICH